MRKRFIDNKSQQSEMSMKYEVGSRKKKNIYFLLLTSYFLLLLIGCAERSPYKYYNVYSLVEPVAVKNGIEQPPNYEKEFEDDKISIKFTINEKKMFFRLKNKTDKELTILWDKISFMDTNGAPHGVAGFENLFTDRMDKQTPQTIRAKGEVNGLIVPLENIEFMEEWTWYIRPLFNRMDDMALENRGKPFSLSMPVEIAGDIIEYNYKFRIDHVIPSETWIQ
jgi:hypothetical protein